MDFILLTTDKPLPTSLVLGYAIATIIMIIVFKALAKKIKKDPRPGWRTLFKVLTVAYGLAALYFFYILIDWAFL